MFIRLSAELDQPENKKYIKYSSLKKYLDDHIFNACVDKKRKKLDDLDPL